MKRKSTTTTTYARKKLKRSTSLSAKLNTKPLKTPIVARKQTAMMIYGESFKMDNAPGTSGVASVVFSGNGLYDPLYNGAGHQPRGFDQLMALYRRYRVKRVLVELWADATDGNVSNMISISARTHSASVTNPIQFLEDPDSTFKVMSSNSGGNSSVYIKKEINVEKWMEPYDKADCSGTATGNPLTQMYVHLSSIGVHPDVNAGEFAGRIKITYETEFSDVLDPGLS